MFLIYFFIVFLFIYLFIYLFRDANVMQNVNLMHRSFFPTDLPNRLPFLFLFLALPFIALPVSLPGLVPCPAYFLTLPISLTCQCLLPSAYAFFLCIFPLPTAYSYHYSFSVLNYFYILKKVHTARVIWLVYIY